MLGFYFIRRRALVNVLVLMGVFLGIMFWLLFFGYFLEDLGWRGIFFIFGGVFFYCCVCGVIVRFVVISMVFEIKEGFFLFFKIFAFSCLVVCGWVI